jgi:transposase
MSAAETNSFSASSPNTRPWTPTDRDRMIFRWIKFEGYKQSWVAEQLEINQSTVSRIVERYDRWIAHGGPAQQGALSRDERLRAQRWLTYERNEWMLTSALRMAGEMERMSDTSKSTTKHYCSEPSRELEVRTENSIRDRTGMVCRYLRLAYRINMDQLKLVQQDDLPALEPLLLDEHEYAQALEDVKPKYVNVFPNDAASEFRRESPDAAPDTPTRRASEDQSSSTPNESISSADLSPPLPPSVSPSPTHAASMHTVHNQQPPQSPLTSDTTITSVEIAPHKKPFAHAYPVAANPPEPTGQLDPVLNATLHQPPPPNRIHPLHVPMTTP